MKIPELQECDAKTLNTSNDFCQFNGAEEYFAAVLSTWLVLGTEKQIAQVRALIALARVNQFNPLKISKTVMGLE